jgi:hypothetical protein
MYYLQKNMSDLYNTTSLACAPILCHQELSQTYHSRILLIYDPVRTSELKTIVANISFKLDFKYYICLACEPKDLGSGKIVPRISTLFRVLKYQPALSI